LRLLVEIFQLKKSTKPPTKTVVDRRFFEVFLLPYSPYSPSLAFQVKQLPGAIKNCEYRLKKDQCVLTLTKTVPQSWANSLSAHGL
jgi:hypothetical protein